MAVIDPAFGRGVAPVKVPKLTGGITASKEAQSLYVDPTPAYQPLIDQLNEQKRLANERYGKNKTDITNLFGSLTTLAAQDAARVKEQFTKSIASQQASLAARTAEARTEAAAGQAQAVATGAERGGGPAMATSPVAVAAEEGIARSNEYQTTWEALQNANQQQSQTDITNRQAGYGQQQVGALQQLQQNLENKLLEIGGNTAQVQSDIAKAKIGMTQDVAKANYNEIQAAKEAAARLAAAQAKASTPKTQKGIQGFYERATAAGIDPEQLATSVDQARVAAKQAIAKNWDPVLQGKVPEPTQQQVISWWRQQNPGSGAYAPFANEYITQYYFG